MFASFLKYIENHYILLCFIFYMFLSYLLKPSFIIKNFNNIIVQSGKYLQFIYNSGQILTRLMQMGKNKFIW